MFVFPALFKVVRALRRAMTPRGSGTVLHWSRRGAHFKTFLRFWLTMGLALHGNKRLASRVVARRVAYLHPILKTRCATTGDGGDTVAAPRGVLRVRVSRRYEGRDKLCARGSACYCSRTLQLEPSSKLMPVKPLFPPRGAPRSPSEYKLQRAPLSHGPRSEALTVLPSCWLPRVGGAKFSSASSSNTSVWPEHPDAAGCGATLVCDRVRRRERLDVRAGGVAARVGDA